VPSTRPRQGLGSDGSSGAYRGAARPDEPVPPDIGSGRICGLRRRLGGGGRGGQPGRGALLRRRRGAGRGEGFGLCFFVCPDFTVYLSFYCDFWVLVGVFEPSSNSGSGPRWPRFWLLSPSDRRTCSLPNPQLLSATVLTNSSTPNNCTSKKTTANISGKLFPGMAN
jgi:hypothetical protein